MSRVRRDRRWAGAKLRAALCSIVLCAPLAAPAQSSSLYRCGNTYSQTPCAADAQPARLHRDAAAERPAVATGFDLCAAAARRRVESPEPESARIVPIGARTSEVITYAGQPLSAHRYDLSIDAKTAYGVFSGPVAYSCWLSEDQARVLQFGPRRAR